MANMDETIRPELSVRVSEDRLAVLVDCSVPEDDPAPLLDALKQQLAGLRIASPPDGDALAEWLRGQVAAHGSNFKDAVVCEGTAPKPSVDGRIEWAGNFFDHGFVLDETTGAIDYRRHAARLSVTEGQLLATVVPPIAGEDGQDVFGHRIRVEPARAVMIRAGENLKKDGPEGCLYAGVDGRLRWADDTLSVDKVYHVQGSVGLETGDVNHPGAVEVSGDILEDAKVYAQGDIDVQQVVEHADISTGGSLTVRGGISGGGHKTVVAGAVHARYILDAHIEAGQDIVVEREIVHSSVKTLGAIVMPKGRLLGGETVALRGAQIGQISSVAAVPTTLIVGEDFRLPEALASKQKAAAGVNAELAGIEARLAQMRGRMESLTAGTKAKLIQLRTRGEELKRQLDAIIAEMDEIRDQSASQAKYRVEVATMIYPETTICMGTERLKVQKEIPGPVRLMLLDGQIQTIIPER